MALRHARSSSLPRALTPTIVTLAVSVGLYVAFVATNSDAGTASRSVDPAPAHCLANPPGAEYQRRLSDYSLPDVGLTTADGAEVRAVDLLETPQPVMLNFIFTSCNTICPVLSATFAQVRKLLGAEAERVRFVSISIDPEQDTPATLAAYARRYGADGHWQFLTGTRDDIIRLQRAFDAYRGNKMSHVPLTFVRLDADGPWLRLEGFPRAADLVREYRALGDEPAGPAVPAGDA